MTTFTICYVNILLWNFLCASPFIHNVLRDLKSSTYRFKFEKSQKFCEKATNGRSVCA